MNHAMMVNLFLLHITAESKKFSFGSLAQLNRFFTAFDSNHSSESREANCREALEFIRSIRLTKKGYVRN